jgi:hypothetical protein
MPVTPTMLRASLSATFAVAAVVAASGCGSDYRPAEQLRALKRQGKPSTESEAPANNKPAPSG